MVIKYKTLYYHCTIIIFKLNIFDMETTVKTTNTLNKAIPADARIFLTDYGSYNEGTQFEFGHWVSLDRFADADQLNAYISKHFKEADKKRPLGFGSIREEIMITDFEGFPEAFYSECMDFEPLYEYFERAFICNYDTEVIEAFMKMGIVQPDNDNFFQELEERYYGEFDNDEDFTMDYVEMCGDYDFSKPQPFPLNNIDWHGASIELMQDYYEQDGHYFRAS